MQYEVGESTTHPGYYSAEGVDYERDGEIYVTLFLGPRSLERAEEFAARENSSACCGTPGESASDSSQLGMSHWAQR